VYCLIFFSCASNPNVLLLVYLSLFCVSRQFSFVLFNSSPLCPGAHSICSVSPCDRTELLISAIRTRPWHSPRTVLLLPFHLTVVRRLLCHSSASSWYLVGVYFLFPPIHVSYAKNSRWKMQYALLMCDAD
jgi:hypothetical protein